MSEVQLDRDRCEGHGLCEQSAPAIFRLDDDGEVQILPYDDTDPDTLRMLAAAVRSCPVAALRLSA